MKIIVKKENVIKDKYYLWNRFIECLINEEVKKSLILVGAEEYAKNFNIAIETGNNDDYISTDDKFGGLMPELTDIIEKYVIDNISEFFIIE